MPILANGKHQVTIKFGSGDLFLGNTEDEAKAGRVVIFQGPATATADDMRNADPEDYPHVWLEFADTTALDRLIAVLKRTRDAVKERLHDLCDWDFSQTEAHSRRYLVNVKGTPDDGVQVLLGRVKDKLLTTPGYYATSSRLELLGLRYDTDGGTLITPGGFEFRIRSFDSQLLRRLHVTWGEGDEVCIEDSTKQLMALVALFDKT